jgi:hypothetical protein
MTNIEPNILPIKAMPGNSGPDGYVLSKSEPSYLIPDPQSFIMEEWKINGYINNDSVTPFPFPTFLKSEGFQEGIVIHDSGLDKPGGQNTFSGAFEALHSGIAETFKSVKSLEDMEIQSENIINREDFNIEVLELNNRILIHWDIVCMLLYTHLVKTSEGKEYGLYNHIQFKEMIVKSFGIPGIFNFMFTQLGKPTPQRVSHWTLAKGWSNPGNSCFMDSLLACMFIHPKSPFINNMLQIKLLDSHPTNPKFPYANVELLKILQAVLINEVDSFFTGNIKSCSDFRNVLAQYIQVSNPNYETFAFGMHDPMELYSILTSSFQYHPMDIKTLSVRSGTRDNMPSLNSQSNAISIPSVSLTPLLIEETEIIQWPDSWLGKVEEVIGVKDNMPFRKEGLEVTRADAFIVPISRRDNSGNDITILEKEIEIKREIVNSTGTYKLYAAVYVPGTQDPTTFMIKDYIYKPGGHYAALLFDDDSDSWYNYDDLKVLEGNIAHFKITDEEAGKWLRTRAVMLFYYNVNSPQVVNL